MPTITFSLGLTGLLVTGSLTGACGALGPIGRTPSASGVRSATVADPVDPAPTATSADYLPLNLGQTWRYTAVGSEARGETRSDTIVQLLERPARDGSGTMTVAEIERTESGKARQRFTLEHYPNGLVRSYDPSLPRLGTPILSARSDKPQEWGYNPSHGETGYFGIVQWPGTTTVTVGDQAYADCLKVVLNTSGHGFAAFRREIHWAPGVGPVRIVEGDPARKARVYELTAARTR
jgi:hypothetical protein